MAAIGEKPWPRMGGNRWPLTGHETADRNRRDSLPVLWGATRSHACGDRAERGLTVEDWDRDVHAAELLVLTGFTGTGTQPLPGKRCHVVCGETVDERRMVECGVRIVPGETAA